MKFLDEGLTDEIGRVFRRTIGPRFQAKFWSSEEGEEGQTDEEEFATGSDAFEQELEAFEGFTYSRSLANDSIPPPTDTHAVNLPTIEDLEASLKNYPSLATETPAQWFRNKRGNGIIEP